MKSLMKTTKSARPASVERRWHLVDADGLVVGRAATVIANVLRGKHKPSFTPHVDCGDHVIVINAEKVRFTGKKLGQKVYFRHTGYAGGLKHVTAKQVLEGRFPERVLEKAVERMIPRGPLGRMQMRKLHIYSGPDHPHSGQQPELLKIGEMNRKNSVRPVDYSGPIESNRPFIVSCSKSESMSAGEVIAELDRRLLELDNPDDDVRHACLARIIELLPVPATEDRLGRDALLLLRKLPMRLLRSLVENASAPDIARDAARALVRSVYPDHYRTKASVEDEERRALKDLQQIVRRQDLHYFFTLDSRRAAPDAALLEARVWNEFSFELGGTRPRLNEADWIDRRDGLSMQVVGAKLISSKRVPDDRLCSGQLIGCVAEVALEDQPPEKVWVYLYNGDKLIEEQILPGERFFTRPRSGDEYRPTALAASAS